MKAMMKNSPKTKRFGGSRGVTTGSTVEVGVGHLTIHIPNPCVLRLVARSVLLAAAILSFPWLRTILPTPPPACAPATDDNAASTRWVDDPFYLPMLLRDLRRERLMPGLEVGTHSGADVGTGGSNSSIFLGDPGLRLRFLKRNKIMPISPKEGKTIGDGSIDFVLVADRLNNGSLEFVERVLRIGGVVAIRLSSDLPKSFHLPRNYRIVYVRWFGSSIVAIKKFTNAVKEEEFSAAVLRLNRISGRRLLAAPETKKEKKNAINGLEGTLLEPRQGKTTLQALQKRTKFLPNLIGGSVAEYPRRVFIDVQSPGKAGSVNWFKKHHPTKNAHFEIRRLYLEGRVKSRKESASCTARISDWLRRNVREEEYVVMKSDAGAAEEMLKAKAAGLVDELFMECDNQWQKGKRKSERAYWECLALSGQLRDEGIAVHQWWG